MPLEAAKTWLELTEEVGKRVYLIEMADGMIPAETAGRRWDAYFASVKGTSHQCLLPDQILRTVGSALIALKDMGLVDYK